MRNFFFQQFHNFIKKTRIICFISVTCQLSAVNIQSLLLKAKFYFEEKLFTNYEKKNERHSADNILICKNVNCSRVATFSQSNAVKLNFLKLVELSVEIIAKNIFQKFLNSKKTFKNVQKFFFKFLKHATEISYESSLRILTMLKKMFLH